MNSHEFWQKVRRFAKRVPMVRDAVASYFCVMDENTPVWAKATLLAALAYFISPVDAIPDAFVPFGFVDDAAVMTSAIAAIGTNLHSAHYTQADQALS